MAHGVTLFNNKETPKRTQFVNAVCHCVICGKLFLNCYCGKELPLPPKWRRLKPTFITKKKKTLRLSAHVNRVSPLTAVIRRADYTRQGGTVSSVVVLMKIKMTRAFNFQHSRLIGIKTEIPQIYISISDDITGELLCIRGLSSRLCSHEGILARVQCC